MVINSDLAKESKIPRCEECLKLHRRRKVTYFKYLRHRELRDDLQKVLCEEDEHCSVESEDDPGAFQTLHNNRVHEMNRHEAQEDDLQKLDDTLSKDDNLTASKDKDQGNDAKVKEKFFNHKRQPSRPKGSASCQAEGNLNNLKARLDGEENGG